MSAYLSACLASCGRCSQMSMPGTFVLIGLNAPRNSAGASGFMSNVSWCGGPPGSQTKMTAGSFDVRSAACALYDATGPTAADASATEPKRSTSRRLGPGQDAERGDMQRRSDGGGKAG